MNLLGRSEKHVPAPTALSNLKCSLQVTTVLHLAVGPGREAQGIVSRRELKKPVSKKKLDDVVVVVVDALMPFCRVLDELRVEADTRSTLRTQSVVSGARGSTL